MTEQKENILLTNKHVLLCVNPTITDSNKEEFEYLKNNFCGIVFSDYDAFKNYCSLTKSTNSTGSSNVIFYLCGDTKQILSDVDYFNDKLIYIIHNYSYNYGSVLDYLGLDIILCSSLQVPINVHNVGVYFRKFLDRTKDYFNLISSEHQFQVLTESNKPSNAFRKGIYLTDIQEDQDKIKFRLLRCSSNLGGPTDNFRTTDREVINKVNELAEHFFETKTELNHVLAQIYENKIIDNGNKTVEKKAKIKDHSDKTKDMPRNGLIAFCTFYKTNEIGEPHGRFDSKNKYDDNALTRLRFRLKNPTSYPELVEKFDVVLQPNSVFIISLLMNRLYTHEIIPSYLPINKIPTRMGYVIRCSKTEATFENDQTYINDIPLIEPNPDSTKELKDLYYAENATTDIINYPKMYFSLNKGDYMKPMI
jgi:hypothetical protein